MAPTEIIAAKMRSHQLSSAAINAFLQAVEALQSGATGLMRECSLDPIASLPTMEKLSRGRAIDLLSQLAVIKLNGGLGTGMGTEGPKSLIRVKGENTFLDFIAKQMLHLRQGRDVPAFYLMNSFSTRESTLEYLRLYPELLDERGEVDFLQNKVPKLDAETLLPVAWPAEPDLEWCPPGHGDIYPALIGSGLLDRLLQKGIKYLFVSNSDNLGATLDLAIANYFASSDFSFLMEVAERTAADRKGGHLSRRKSDGRFVLRESAQSPKEDETFFQDIERHRFFNTNNLWIRLADVRREIERPGGALRLPLIKNTKNVNPRDPSSPRVVQLESAMGAAIECFEKSGALVVPRSRFSPVKTTSDLLALRSDAYRVAPDYSLALDAARDGEPPVVTLDATHYKLIDDFERYFADGTPSLVECNSITVQGKISFAAGVVCKGRVEFVNPSPDVKRVPEGSYWQARIEF